MEKLNAEFKNCETCVFQIYVKIYKIYEKN